MNTNWTRVAVTPWLLFLSSAALHAAQPVGLIASSCSQQPNQSVVSNNTAVIASALATHDIVEIPSGCFWATAIHVLPGKTLLGFNNPTVASSNWSRVILLGAASPRRAIELGSDSRLENMYVSAGSTGMIGLLVPQTAAAVNVNIVNNLIEGFDGVAQIFVDHANDSLQNVSQGVLYGVSIRGNLLRGTLSNQPKRGIDLVFSNDVVIYNNRILDSDEHGIVAWGILPTGELNWCPPAEPQCGGVPGAIVGEPNRGVVRACNGIQVVENYIDNDAAQTGVWVSGCVNVIVERNTAIGASDVGLDFEWVENGIMSNNHVYDCANACLSAFYSSRNINLLGNSVHGKLAGTRDDLVWLTSGDYPYPSGQGGHLGVLITGNSFNCDTPQAQGSLWVPEDAEDIRIWNNSYLGSSLPQCPQTLGTGFDTPLGPIPPNSLVSSGTVQPYVQPSAPLLIEAVLIPIFF